ncbi:MAG: HAMP domain-containing histidine kinase [Chloroflexi bacterium]|nr:HAMP domain-containing histidine kinase [Chloroflexota bacterium]
MPSVLPLIPLIVATLFIGLYNLAFCFVIWSTRRSGAPPRLPGGPYLLMHLQIALGLAALTILLHYAGGAENPFFPYYVFHVTLAAIVLWQRSSFLYAALVTTLFFAALVVGGLARQLRRRERELVQAQMSCELRASELANLNQRLRQLDQAKSQFMLMVTHELRAPLAAIQSFLQLILQGYASADEQKRIMERTSQRAAELLTLIGDLLALRQASEPPADAGLQWVHPEDVLGSVAELLRGQAAQKGLAFEVEFASDLPRVRALPRDLQLVWTNLISSAIKYTQAGGWVKASCVQHERGLLGAVQDTGIGIPAEALAHVFDEFYRAENARALENRGTGLGLAIVKGIVEKYGGRVWVESVVGEGTTVSFSWPLVTPAPQP